MCLNPQQVKIQAFIRFKHKNNSENTAKNVPFK
jgi:hypothetical protein